MDVRISFSMLLPAVALIVWSMVMLIWMAVTRFSAFKTANIDIAKAPPGGRGRDLDGVLPKEVQWPSHNYNHLMEQPTIFYPTVIILAVTGQANPVNLGLAWLYVGIRVAHSIWQAKVNRVPVRFRLFALSSIVLLILALRALFALLP